MKRTSVFSDQQLTEALRRELLGGKFYVVPKMKNTAYAEQNRVYFCARCAGRKLAMRKFRDGWKATVIE